MHAIQRWFLYRVMIGLAPIAIKALVFTFYQVRFGPVDLVVGPELLLMICALCAGAIGELNASDVLYPKRRQLAAWGCIATVLMAALTYGLHMSVPFGAPQTSIRNNANFVAGFNVFIFTVGLVSAFGSVVLVELAKLKKVS